MSILGLNYLETGLDMLKKPFKPVIYTYEI